MSEKNHVKFAESIRREQMKFAPDQVNMAAGVRDPDELEKVSPREQGVMDEQFPTNDLTSYDERDRVMNAKLALQGDATSDSYRMGYTPFGKLRASDKDFEWVAKKEAAAERANMEAWFARNFDFMSPAQKQYAKKIFPGFYDARRRLLRQQADNVFDIARIKLDGLEDFDDVKKQYLLETGRLDLGPLENLMNPEYAANYSSQDRKNNKGRFQRGLANPWTVFGKEAYPQNVDTRKVQRDDFAERDYNNAGTVKLGVDGKGFPPFKGTNTNQSDAAWFKTLKKGMTSLD